MDLELKPANAGDADFAWSLYSRFVRDNMFSGAANRRSSAEWNEDLERNKFDADWSDGNKYVIAVDGDLVGWASIVLRDSKVIIENWHTVASWQNRNLASTILGDLVPRWRSDGLQIEASLLQGSLTSDAAAKVLVKLGFAEGHLEQHTRVMRVS